MTIILVLISFFLLFVYFFQQYYISELAISFLPYIIVFSLLVCLYQIIGFSKLFRSRLSNKWIIIRFISFTLYFVLLVLYSKPYLNFYTWTYEQITVYTWSNLTILYANIYKDNKNYTWLRDVIEKNNPDLLMFAEFTDDHYQHLQDFFKKNYPYVNRTSWSEDFIWSMVFSKKPIENLIVHYPQWMRRYWYFSMKLNGDDVYFYLVHTSSPITYEYFQMRDTQLNQLSDDFLLQSKNRWSWSKIVVVGDFNLSPRSFYYKKFASDLINMEDYTKNVPLLFTWKFRYLPFLQSHIDHLWINYWTIVDNFQTINIPWSDHKGFLFTYRFGL